MPLWGPRIVGEKRINLGKDIPVDIWSLQLAVEEAQASLSRLYGIKSDFTTSFAIGFLYYLWYALYLGLF